jgi:hypothetical protein
MKQKNWKTGTFRFEDITGAFMEEIQAQYE